MLLRQCSLPKSPPFPVFILRQYPLLQVQSIPGDWYSESGDVEVVRCLVSGVGYLDAQQAGQVDEGSATQPAGHALRRAAVTRKCPQRHARVRSVTRAATQSPFFLSSGLGLSTPRHHFWAVLILQKWFCLHHCSYITPLFNGSR